MRFLEIASPEDPLALWKLVSDKVWAAFAQQLPQASAAPVKPASMWQGRAAIPSKPTAKHLPNAPAKTEKKSTGKPKGRAVKATRAPMVPAPKPQPLSLSSSHTEHLLPCLVKFGTKPMP